MTTTYFNFHRAASSSVVNFTPDTFGPDDGDPGDENNRPNFGFKDLSDEDQMKYCIEYINRLNYEDRIALFRQIPKFQKHLGLDPPDNSYNDRRSDYTADTCTQHHRRITDARVSFNISTDYHHHGRTIDTHRNHDDTVQPSFLPGDSNASFCRYNNDSVTGGGNYESMASHHHYPKDRGHTTNNDGYTGGNIRELRRDNHAGDIRVLPRLFCWEKRRAISNGNNSSLRPPHRTDDTNHHPQERAKTVNFSSSCASNTTTDGKYDSSLRHQHDTNEHTTLRNENRNITPVLSSIRHAFPTSATLAFDNDNEHTAPTSYGDIISTKLHDDGVAFYSDNNNCAKVDDGMVTLPIIKFREGEVVACSTSIKQVVVDEVQATEAESDGRGIPTDSIITIGNFDVLVDATDDHDVVTPSKYDGDNPAPEGAAPPDIDGLLSFTTDTGVVYHPEYGDDSTPEGALPPDIDGIIPSTTIDDVANPPKFDEHLALEGAPPEFDGIRQTFVDIDDIYLPTNGDNFASEGVQSEFDAAASPDFDGIPIVAGTADILDVVVIRPLRQDGDIAPSPSTTDAVPERDIVRGHCSFGTGSTNSASDGDIIFTVLREDSGAVFFDYDGCTYAGIFIAPSTLSNTPTADLNLGGTASAPEGEHRDASITLIDDVAATTSTRTTIATNTITHRGLFGNISAKNSTKPPIATTTINLCELFDDLSAEKFIKSHIATNASTHRLFGHPPLTPDHGSVLFGCPPSTSSTTLMINHRASFGCLSSTSECGNASAMKSTEPTTANTTINANSPTSISGTTWIDNILTTKPSNLLSTMISHRALFGHSLSTSDCRSTITTTTIPTITIAQEGGHCVLFGSPSTLRSSTSCTTAWIDETSAEKPPIPMTSINHRDLLGRLSSRVSLLSWCPSSNSVPTISIGGTTTAPEGEYHRVLFDSITTTSPGPTIASTIDCHELVDDIPAENSITPPITSTTIDHHDLFCHPSSTPDCGRVLFGYLSSTSSATSTVNHRASSRSSLTSDSTSDTSDTTTASEGDIISTVLREDRGGISFDDNNHANDGIFISAPAAPSITTATDVVSEGVNPRSSSLFGIGNTTIAPEGVCHVSFGSLSSTPTPLCSITSLIDDASAKTSPEPTTATTTFNINNDATRGIQVFISAKESIEPSIDDHFRTATVGTFMVVDDNNTLVIPLFWPSNWKSDDGGICRYIIDDGLGDPPQLPTKWSDQYGTDLDNRVVLQGATTVEMEQDSDVYLSDANEYRSCEIENSYLLLRYPSEVPFDRNSMQFHVRGRLRTGQYLIDDVPNSSTRKHLQAKYHWILGHSARPSVAECTGIDGRIIGLKVDDVDEWLPCNFWLQFVDILLIEDRITCHNKQIPANFGDMGSMLSRSGSAVDSSNILRLLHRLDKFASIDEKSNEIVISDRLVVASPVQEQWLQTSASIGKF